MKPSPRILSLALAALTVSLAPARADDEAPSQSAAVPPGEASCEQRPYSILLTVNNVKSAKGIITVDVHGEDPERWLKKGGRIGRVRVPASKGQTVICVPIERAGTYALALYHDKDHNLKLNKNWIGLPSEPFAVSNDAPIRLGPPSFKDAAFPVEGPLTPATVTLSN
jgi:uncharacterized protein (DUF2141 family)